MKLAHTMLEEACNSTQPSTSSQIVYAVRSMFELYTSVVSDYHKQSITDLPQVTGTLWPFILNNPCLGYKKNIAIQIPKPKILGMLNLKLQASNIPDYTQWYNWSTGTCNNNIDNNNDDNSLICIFVYILMKSASGKLPHIITAWSLCSSPSLHWLAAGALNQQNTCLYIS